jgi:hypothetical protein
VIGIGVAASLAWSGFVAYVAIVLVGSVSGRLLEYLAE